MWKTFLSLGLVACATLSAHAVPVGTVTTVAGGNALGDGVLAANAVYSEIAGVAIDGQGNMFLADGNSNYRLRKIGTDGIVRTVAGNGVRSYSGEGGPAVAATLSPDGGVALDAQGNLYVADGANNRVLRIDAASGIITTVAGNGTAGFSGDGGPATAASLNGPLAVAIASDGSVLVSDYANRRVRRIAGGTITTVAGDGTVRSFNSDLDAGEGGPATSFSITAPFGLAADASGGFFVVDYLQNRIRHVDAAGIITTVAGKGALSFGLPQGDGGPAISASLFAPRGLARDAAGNLYFADYYSLRKIDTAGVIHTVAGTGSFNQTPGYAAPYFVAADATGNVFFSESDQAQGKLRKVDTAGVVTTLAGSATSYTGDGGPALLAGLGIFTGRAAPRADGTLFLPDHTNNDAVVRRIDTGGTIQPFMPGFSATIDPSGSLVIVDAGRRHIQRVDGSGGATTIAGSGATFHFGDGGPAMEAGLESPNRVVFGSDGSFFIAETSYIRKVDAAGMISTIAGTGTSVSGGDGGPATAAGFTVSGMAIDTAGNLYIADRLASRVRKVDANGVITTFAGTGFPGFSGDGGPATAAQLRGPSDVAVDDLGNVYIADHENSRVRKVASDGTLSTFAGTGTAGYGPDDVAATASALFGPVALAWSDSGDLYVTEDGFDGQNFGKRGARLRRIRVGDSTPDPFAFTAQQGVAESIIVQSNIVTPAGFDMPSPISVTGGEYSIGCAGAFTSTVGTFQPGQSVCVRHTSASIGNDSVRTTLRVGATFAKFASSTAPDSGSASAAPASLAFGATWTNHVTPEQDVTVTNTGATPLTVLGVTATADFAVANDCATLAPAASCAIHVSFVPLFGGARDTTLVVRHSAGNAGVTLTGTGERSLTRHYYETILRREPDSTGFAFWEAEAHRFESLGANVNETWFAMAMSFYGSAEYAAFNRDDRAFVTDLYHTFFDREPDAGGLDYWSGLVTQGMPRGVALAQFMFSPEFVNFATVIFGHTQVRPEMDMVTDFYRGLLGRLPDDDGFSHWLGVLRTGQCQGVTPLRLAASQLGQQFLGSAEYLARNRTDEQFVGDLYNAYLRRGGDLPGVQFWLQKLGSGTTRAAVAGAFELSPEFFLRTRQVVAAGCIPAP